MSPVHPEPIAIVGFGFRLPGGATNAEGLWEILAEGRQCWTDVPESRYNWKGFHHANPDAKGTHNARGGFFLEQNIADFDAQFFGMSATESAAVDPQQRLLLEVSYEALENAGLPLEHLRGSQTGVYVALVSRDYDRQIYKDPMQIPKHHLTGCGDATACGRISYVFDFKGPCMSLDTGCSGGMVGVHLACQALQLGESSLALVGGTNLLLGPDMTMAMSNLHMVNDNGRCYPFDSRGAGYGRAEGVAVVVLKRLSDALKDGDSVRAIIRGSGIGQDGKTNGILLPSSQAQRDLAASLYKKSGIDPQKVAYVEAHGTGTQAGDAAEVNSIKEVFIGDQSTRNIPLLLGSIKANLGHSESASGLAGILKATLSLEKALIPPVAQLVIQKEDVTKAIRDSAVHIPTKLEHWPHSGVRYASVNSFGFGGSNAHVILESAPEFDVPSATSPHSDWKTSTSNGINRVETNCSSPERLPSGSMCQHELFVVSARSKPSLEQMTADLKLWLERQELTPSLIQNLAYTLNKRRSRFNWRSSFVASTQSGLWEALGAARHIRCSNTLNVVFLFTGQGAQYATMGRELLGFSNTFANSLRKSQRILRELGASWNLLDELSKPEKSSRVNSSELSQPTTTAIQVALVDLLKDLGVQPRAVIGHSSGEVGAAYAAGALTQYDALNISYHKGFVADWCRQVVKTKGAMLAVGLGERQISQYLEQVHCGTASVACVNSPSSVTVSGDESAVFELQKLLNDDSVFNRLLKVDIAYHSHHMKAVCGTFGDAISAVKNQDVTSGTSFFSSVTGKSKTTNFGPSYWVDNLVSKVRFSDALENLVETYRGSGSPPLHFVEVGPHSALQGPIRQILTSFEAESVKWSYSCTLVRTKDAHQAVLEALGNLWEQGISVNMDKVIALRPESSSARRRPLTDLPPYPWEHSSTHWFESRLSKDYRLRQHRPHDLLGLRLTGTTTIEPVFRHILNVDDQPWLQQHIIDGFALYPGSAFLVHAIEGLKQISQDRGQVAIQEYCFKDVSFNKALVVPSSPASVEILVSLKPSRMRNERLSMTWLDFRVTSQSQEGVWNEHCQGFIRAGFGTGDESPLIVTDQIEKAHQACELNMPAAHLYEDLRHNGIDYGEDFSIIKRLKIGHQLAVAHVEIPDIRRCMPGGEIEPHVIHPALFDAFMHVAIPIYHRHCTRGPVMLTHIGEASVSASIVNNPGAELAVVCKLTQAERRFGAVNVSIAQSDERGVWHEVCSLTQEEFRSIGEGGNQKSSPASVFQSYNLEWCPLAHWPSQSRLKPTQRIEISQISGSRFATTLAFDLANHLPNECQGTVVQYRPELMNVDSLQVVINEWSSASRDDHINQSRVQETARQLAQFKSVLLVSIAPIKPAVPIVTAVNPVTRREGQKLVTLEYQDISSDEHKLIHLLEEIITTSFAVGHQSAGSGADYRYCDGTLMALKLVPHEPTAARLKSIEVEEPVKGIAAYHQPHRSIKLDFTTPGLLTSACFIEDEKPQTAANTEHVLVKVHAHAINQTDVAIALGRALPSEAMVGEFSGVVVGVGSGAVDKFSIGDRVCGWGSSPYTNIASVNFNFLHRIADDVSFAEGATIPLAFQTAYHALIDLAHMESSQRILIHGAAGAVGQAAILLARHIGAEIYVTVGDEKKMQMLMNTVHIDPNHIFSSRSAVFAHKIRELTGGTGVDIVLNCCSTDLIDASLSCVSEFGTFINLPKSGAELSASSLRNNISVVSVDMDALRNRHPAKTQTKFQKVMALYNEGFLGPLRYTCLPMEEFVQGFKLVQTQNGVGKVVLSADDTTRVRQVLERPDLDAEATYVVHGPHSVTSKNIVQYLKEHGGAHVFHISNTGEIERHSSSGVQKLVDSKDECSSIKSVVRDSLANMPPIKGLFDLRVCDEVIQGFSLFDVQLTTLQIESSLVETTKNGGNPLKQSDAITTGVLTDILQDQQLDFLITISPMAVLAESGNVNRTSIGTKIGRVTQHHMRLFLPDPAIIQGPFPAEGLLGRDDNGKTNEACVTALWDYGISRMANKEATLDLFFVDHTQLERFASETGLRQHFPFFNDLVSVSVSHKGQSEHNVESVGQKLKKTSDEHQVHKIILDEVCRQLVDFCALEVEDMTAEAAIADIGLDSLLAIEFKNSIVKTLGAQMQTTEILDAPTLNDLTKLIAQRSKFVTDTSKVEGVIANGHGVDRHEALSDFNNVDTSDLKLPLLQIPPLKSLIDRHLTYVRAFASEEEFQVTKGIADRFQQPSGPGSRLYDRLLAVKDANPEDWYHDLYLKSQYLARKGALAPYMLFFFSHPLSLVQHSQSTRAALITSTLIRYKNALENGKIKPRYLHEQQLCMDLYKNLFNTCRKPQLGLDSFEKYNGVEYFVVLRQGHGYKVDFRGIEENLDHETLEATFAGILKQEPIDIDWTGILTADHRVSWARNYQTFVKTSLQNARYIETMERAAFIICLDDAQPETPEKRARQIHFGNGFNRWFDKSMQFVVCSNGISGIVADHTGLDAPTVQELNMLIADAISKYDPSGNSLAGRSLEAEKLAHNGFVGIDEEIQRIRVNFENAIGTQHHFFPESLPWGSSLVKSYKLPPNSIFQLVVQIAAFRYFGYIPATWETVLQSTFHKGRVEINQIVSQQVATFVKAAVDSEVPVATCRQLLTEAARTHSGTVLSCTRAGGSDRFLTILRDMVEEGEEEPELYRDPVYKRSRPRKLMSSCFKTHMAENGCFMKDGNAIWLHFEVEEDRRSFSSGKHISALDKIFRVSEEVQDALATGKPVVALETTIYTHGYPYPENVALSSHLESLVRVNGGVPATIGVLNGVAQVGMGPEQLIELVKTAGQKTTWKLSRRDLGFIGGLGLRGQRLNGGTTIAGTMILAHLAGIKIFATGGLGGVHRGGENSMDISADLTELGRTPVTVISSGCKSFLDIARTLEFLETQGVGVGTFADGRRGDVEFPAFFCRDSGVKSPQTIRDEVDAAAIVYAQSALGLQSGFLFANPVPEDSAMVKEEIDSIISAAVAESQEKGISGNANTPYILKRIRELSEGRSIKANTALVEGNVIRGTKVAVELAKLERGNGVAPPRHESIIVPRSKPLALPASPNPSHTGKPSQTQAGAVDVLVAGSLASDTICDYQPLDDDPTKSSPILSTSNPAQIAQAAGGVGHNVALAAHFAGAKVSLASVVADDLAGNTLIEYMAKSGLPTRHILQIPTASGARTAQYMAVNDRNKDLVVAMADMSILVRSELESLEYWTSLLAESKPEWVVVDANWSPSILSSILTAAQLNKANIAFEPVSVAKAARLFHKDNTAITRRKVVPEHIVNLAAPNQFELTALFNAAREASMFESEEWWTLIDSYGLSASTSRARLTAVAGRDLVEEGIPQQCIQLLPFIPNMVIKLGRKGCLVANLLKEDDAKLRNPDYAPYIVARSHAEDRRIGGVYMRLFRPSHEVQQSEIVSVNGIGDTMLGVIVAGLVQRHTLETVVPIAQDAAVLTLKSAQPVSPEVRSIQARLTGRS
ncbi:hypothetical protein LTR84_012454 [Exophiala bonariae]|uniref:Carrier domain-containing protein n=1 Tax=Exophiala bonariae TaxID=1690606 RepID=A0AAV9NEC9_9EURO|nr:hypothetical protein LTR84_012454 [Exophiala bonariae]